MKLIKKGGFIGYIAAVMFLTLGLLGSPTNASAAQIMKSIVSEDEIMTTSVSREVSVTADWHGSQPYPPSIYYNVNGYKGYIYLKDVKWINTYAELTYRGTVTCTGVCIAPSSQIIEK
ncbi:hypothetical protein [Psychrobacillus sp. FSL H8-0510]|uniref:hypothetical protein n=1 Tax=Psychrobacillus sp. FSL H8-0510 TaxID=2921394 RepID=UPI0030F4E729